MNSQYKTLAISMYPYENKTHLPSQFNNNYWAAEYAGCLFDKWASYEKYGQWFDETVEDDAWNDYKTFVDTFKESLESEWKWEYVNVTEALSQQDIEQTHESFLLGTRF